MSFPKYPAYKDSGVEWLGEVPEHWSANPLKRAFKVEGGSTPTPDEANWDGDIAWVTPADLGGLSTLFLGASKRTITLTGLASCGTTLLPAGSLILSTRAPIGSLAIALTRMCTNQGCKGLVPYVDASSTYFAYVLLTAKAELNNRGKGTTFLEISGDELGRFVVPAPPFPEQTQIARFLDHETARIDALIEEQQRLIELLKEKRQAVISHAVTKGLDPTVPMKDSGVEWLGEVPAHWVVMQLSRTLEKVEQGWSPNASNEPAAPDKWGVIKISAIKKGVFVGSENKALLEDTRPELAFEIRDGDVLITRANTPDLVGDACVVRNDSGSRLMLSDLAYRLRLGPGIDAGFICYFLLSHLGRAQIKSDARGSSMSMAKISQGHIKAWLLALPSYSEQVEISKFISDEIGKHDELIRVATESHTLLAERRSALISAAVTGKIDVRGWQPPASASQQQSEALEA